MAVADWKVKERNFSETVKQPTTTVGQVEYEGEYCWQYCGNSSIVRNKRKI